MCQRGKRFCTRHFISFADFIFNILSLLVKRNNHNSQQHPELFRKETQLEKEQNLQT